MAKGERFPKVKCCESRTKCQRCPLRMLKEGTLPDGYAVRKRRLVTLDGQPVPKPVKSKKAKKGKKAKEAAGKRRAAALPSAA